MCDTMATVKQKRFGPFGELRPLALSKTSEAKLIRFHCYGWMDKVDGEWRLNERGLQLFYYV